jgi:CHAT domain-containing protein
MRKTAILAIILFGCSRWPGEQLDALFERAQAELQAGNLDAARADTDRGAALAIDRRNDLLVWKFRLLHCEALLLNGRSEEVLSLLQGSSPVSAVQKARKKLLQSQAHSILGHSTESEALLDEAEREAKAENAEDLILDTEVLRGSILVNRERLDEAEVVLNRALTRSRLLRSPYDEAGVLTNLGRIRLARNRYEEAAVFLDQAAAVSGPRFRILYSVIQDNLAQCYSQLGEYDRALEVQLKTISEFEHLGETYYLPRSLGGAGDAYLNQGDIAHAIPYLKRSLSLAIEMNRLPVAAEWAGSLADLYIEQRDWTNAEALNAEAIRLKNSAGLHTLFYNALYSGRIAEGRGDLDAAARYFSDAIATGSSDPTVLWEAHAGLGILEQRRNHAALANKEFEAALDLIERTRGHLVRTESKLPFLTRSIRVYRQYVDALLSQGEIERALAVADSSRAQVLAGRAGSAPARHLSPGAFSKLAKASGTTLLSYWLSPERSHAWVVTAREICHVDLAGAKEIEPLVAQYQEALEDRLVDPLRTPLTAGEKLYQLLIAPVLQRLPPDSRVVVVPDGVLHGLNLETLPVPGAKPHYWIQDVTLEIAPSLSVWGRSPSVASGRGLLLLGDPIINEPGFQPLAHAAAEIARIRRHFAPSEQIVLTGDSATPQAFFAKKGAPYGAVHFTAHALANRERPLESTVLLSGGRLYARDIMDLKLDTDLVTVSACRGAGRRTYSGEGLVGFAWAFLRAGARNVIAGLWDVNDQSTASLMDALYRDLAAGKRPAEALRAAKLALLASRGNFKKPYYWAPFELYTVAP